MNLIALFSVNLGIFNLIPLPMLDGGRVVLTLYEIIFKRDINKKVEQALMTFSLFLVLLLIVYTTWNDLARLLLRQELFNEHISYRWAWLYRQSHSS